jgi:NADH-quinone oxidoreductase subunit C
MIDLIKSKFPAAVRDTIEFRGETTLVIEPAALIAVATFLRDEASLGFDLLSDVSAVDHYPDRPRFAVNYHFYALENALSLRVKAWLDGETPSIASLTGVYPGANWHEREVWDLMGIRFEGHPDLRRIFMPDDFLGHPLRKDAAQFYEEPQFTHNFDEIERQKPYAKA